MFVRRVKISGWIYLEASSREYLIVFFLKQFRLPRATGELSGRLESRNSNKGRKFWCPIRTKDIVSSVIKLLLQLIIVKVAIRYTFRKRSEVKWIYWGLCHRNLCCKTNRGHKSRIHGIPNHRWRWSLLRFVGCVLTLTDGKYTDDDSVMW